MASNFIAGSLAGVSSAILLQPFDVLKTSILVNSANSGVARSIALVYNEYGISGFWRGVSPGICRAIIGGGMNFYTLEYFRKYFKSSDSLMDQISNDSKAAATSRFLTILVLSPLTVVKVRMEAMGSNQYRSIVHGLQTIAREEGVKGLYKGLLPNIIRDIPFSALAFSFYSQYQKALSDSPDQPNIVVKFLSGVMAGFSATVITHPFDVVKTRLQYAHLNKDPSLQYSGTLQGISSIWRSEGLVGFTRGLSIRLIEKSISYGLVWSLYESYKRILQ